MYLHCHQFPSCSNFELKINEATAIVLIFAERWQNRELFFNFPTLFNHNRLLNGLNIFLTDFKCDIQDITVVKTTYLVTIKVPEGLKECLANLI